MGPLGMLTKREDVNLQWTLTMGGCNLSISPNQLKLNLQKWFKQGWHHFEMAYIEKFGGDISRNFIIWNHSLCDYVQLNVTYDHK
jgi:hypothetical protein